MRVVVYCELTFLANCRITKKYHDWFQNFTKLLKFYLPSKLSHAVFYLNDLCLYKCNDIYHKLYNKKIC